MQKGGEKGRGFEEKVGGFFACRLQYFSGRARICVSVVRNVLLRGPLDNWRCFLTLIGLSVFFVLGLPLPYIYLCFKHQTYAYLWLGFWVAFALLMFDREMTRRDEHLKFPKWFNNPRAIQEYIELLKD